ncbi:hypothetical protein [Gemmatirosa kalamazoonensis]|uniref:hypothetical protein n=1 Tax=Gemmatirosa kalamazoonensis TaxID=861299 RepID=UPI00046D261C|nr:hypothetical protein [Gemmatirosa kalamazoonensis]
MRLHAHLLAAVCLAQPPITHRHPHAERLDVRAEFADVAMADTTLARGTTRDTVVTDPARRYDAFTVSTGQRVRLYVADRRMHRVREVRGIPFDWRPLSDLAWKDGRTLLFDRWSSPHDGVHYVLDVARGRLVAAAGFHEDPGEGLQRRRRVPAGGRVERRGDDDGRAPLVVRRPTC